MKPPSHPRAFVPARADGISSSVSPGSDTPDGELGHYQTLLAPHVGSDDVADISATGSAIEELKMSPLVWWDVKDFLLARSRPDRPIAARADLQEGKNYGKKGKKGKKDEREVGVFEQYGVLGQRVEWKDEKNGREGSENDSEGSSEDQESYTASDDSYSIESPPLIKPVLLNTNSPWSAFLCGSQGSGKSHALSVMLENCLLINTSHGGTNRTPIGKNPKPLAGLVFHYDQYQSSDVCEAAYLSSHIPTTVLVPPSNFGRLSQKYSNLKTSHNAKIKVKKLYLLPKYLDTERVKSLMAVGRGEEMPLYMQVVIKILRDMAIRTSGLGAFDYAAFKSTLSSTTFVRGQEGPLTMRLDLLESFMAHDKRGKLLPTTANTDDNLIGQPGHLTIIDLTDPVIDADSACALFHICLSVWLSQTKCGKVIALDEAHNYMQEGRAAAEHFSGLLLKTVREQRHVAARVIVATQEPGVCKALLDLCSVVMVHRCTSPAWFAVLREHIAALYLRSREGSRAKGMSAVEGNGAGVGLELDAGELFRLIVELKLGESLLFCPTAAVGVREGRIQRMDAGFVKFKTRKRVTADGGRSKLADDGSL